MVRPIELQHVMAQSNSMERVQQTQQQHPDQRQRYLDIQAKEEKKHAKEAVKDSEKSEHARVQEKKEEAEKKKHSSEHYKKDDDKTEPEKDPDDSEHGGIIDIRV